MTAKEKQYEEQESGESAYEIIVEKWERESCDRLLDRYDYNERVIYPAMQDYATVQTSKYRELVEAQDELIKIALNAFRFGYEDYELEKQFAPIILRISELKKELGI